jgi:alkyl hydroperoxide reductase subunit AhpC
LTDAVAEVYQKDSILHGFNGDESDELPLATTYVIDQNGVVIHFLMLNIQIGQRLKTSWQLLIQ